MNIPVVIKHPGAVVPEYKTSGSAGCDLYACDSVRLKPGETRIVPTGLVVEIPEGYEGQVRLRSGVALKTPLIIPNAPGTIDSDYRGEIGIIVKNIGQYVHLIEAGERIAQLVICPVVQASFNLVQEDEISDTVRGSGGFGHTGSGAVPQNDDATSGTCN